MKRDVQLTPACQTKLKENPPVLWCRRVPSRYRRLNPIDSLYVYCPICQREHCHGSVRNEPGAGDGHRTAHCRPGTGFERLNGYVIAEVNETLDAIKAHNEQVIV